VSVNRWAAGVNIGSVMATVKVRLDGGDQVVTASITKEAVEELGLAVGRSSLGPLARRNR